MFGNIAGNISNIGLGAVQKANFVGADKDLGADIAKSIEDWNEFKKRKAFIDKLTADNPDDADKIMYDPEGYAKFLDEKAKMALDQQYKLEYLDKQNQNALALENLRNQNALSLARLQESLKSGTDSALREERLKLLENELNAGRLSQDEYNKGVLALNLGSNIYKAAYGTDKPMSLKDLARAIKDLQSANVDTGSLNDIAANSGFDLKFNDTGKTYQKGDIGSVQYMVDTEGLTPAQAWARIGKMSPDEKLAYEVSKAQQVGDVKLGQSMQLADHNFENNVNLEGIKQSGRIDLANLNAANNLNNSMATLSKKSELSREEKYTDFVYDVKKMGLEYEKKKNLAEFVRTLKPEDIIRAEYESQITGTPVENILKQSYDKRQADIDGQLSEIELRRAQTQKTLKEASDPAVTFREKEEIKYDIKRKGEEDKARMEAEKSAKQNEAMRPRVIQAIDRAEKALDEGTGLGQFGGWGWTTQTGGVNRAAIQSAQAQINTVMRGLLKEMGVGSTELNSAAEAAAYRYQITPDMPISQQKQIIENFKKDYLDGTVRKEAAIAASQHGGQAPDIDVNDPRVQEALNNGYTMDQIKEYLGK